MIIELYDKEEGKNLNKYTVPFILIGLGVVMATDIFPMRDPYKIACLNLCAFLLTISCINLGSMKSKWRTRISKSITFILQTMAMISFFLLILDENSKYYDNVYNFIVGLNPNSLLIIGLSATLISIYASKDYDENQQKNTDKQIERLKKEIRTLDKICLDLKDNNVSLKEQKKQLIEVNEKLNEKLQEAIDAQKDNRK